jgi:glycine/D-amino acid oxidase-like deaminating enzyme
MRSDSGGTTSLWMASTEMPPVTQGLTADAQADVCVVGAGIAGLSTAYLLSKEGLKVLVLDDGPIAGGETARTTAHLSSALDDRFYEIERLHGRTGARLAAESHGSAIDRIESIVAAEKIDCDFTRLDGYLFLPPGGSVDELDDELAAATRAGLEVERLPRAPLPHFDTGPCLRFGRQGQFHPLKYLAGLVRAIQAAGSTIVTGAHAVDFKGGDDAHVTTQDGRVVRCRHVVVATNAPVNDRVVIHTKQAPYRTYVIGCPVAKGTLPRMLLWDMADPYHYVRLQRDPDGTDVLIVGGEDHKTGQEEDMEVRWHRLASWTRERFPDAGAPKYKWSGQVLEPSQPATPATA